MSQPAGRVAPVSVPLPRPRPMSPDGIPLDIPMAPSVAASSAPALPGTAVDPSVPAAGAVAAEDPGLAIPAADGSDPYWGAVAAAANQYRPGGESPFAAGLQGFINAQAAYGKIESENERAAREQAMQDEAFNWKREDRGIAAEDRAYERRWNEEDRSYDRQKDTREFGLRENADQRAAAAEGRDAKAFDYELLQTAADIERKIENGEPVTGDDLNKRSAYVKTQIETWRSNQDATGWSDEELNANIKRLIEDDMRAQGRARENNRVVGAADPDAIKVPAKEDGAQPGAVSDNNEDETGAVDVPELPKEDMAAPRVGTMPRSGRPSMVAAGPAPDEPAPPVKPSDVFPPTGEKTGAGTREDPILGAPDDPEQAKNWAKLNVRPGEVFVYRGTQYIAR